MNRIFVDMDGVVVDFELYMAENGLSIEETKHRPGAYLAMKPFPGAIEAVRRLIGMGFEVWVATKPPTGNSSAYAEKAEWIFHHLPELRSRIIITHDKGLLGDAGDYLCDDFPHRANCEQFAGTLVRFVDGYHWPQALGFFEEVLQQRAGAVPATPSSTWRAKGLPDPHAGHYDRERAGLALGELTDDELANGAFLNYDRRLSASELVAGTVTPAIVWMTAVKDRLRWLSRRLEEATLPAHVQELSAPVEPTSVAAHYIRQEVDRQMSTFYDAFSDPVDSAGADPAPNKARGRPSNEVGSQDVLLAASRWVSAVAGHVKATGSTVLPEDSEGKQLMEDFVFKLHAAIRAAQGASNDSSAHADPIDRVEPVDSVLPPQHKPSSRLRPGA